MDYEEWPEENRVWVWRHKRADTRNISFFVLSSLANLFPLKENWYLSSPPKQNYVSTQDLEAPHAALPPFFL